MSRSSNINASEADGNGRGESWVDSCSRQMDTYQDTGVRMLQFHYGIVQDQDNTKLHPTLQNIRIRSTEDANTVLSAVALCLLPLIRRPPSKEEARGIKAGDVYIWEEQRQVPLHGKSNKVPRWKDGMNWGPSRVRDPSNDHPQQRCLYYKQRSSLPTTQAEEEHLLMKQTYSAYMNIPIITQFGQSYKRAKWHMIAYYTPSSENTLGTIDDIPGIGEAKFMFTKLRGWMNSLSVLHGSAQHLGIASSYDQMSTSLESNSGRRLARLDHLYVERPPVPDYRPISEQWTSRVQSEE